MADSDTREQTSFIIKRKKKKLYFKKDHNNDLKQSAEIVDGEDTRRDQIIFGDWVNVDDVASNLWGSIHGSLLEYSGPFFAYKSTKQGTGLVQVVVVMNYSRDNNTIIPGSFGVGLVTTGYSALLPNVPTDYLTKVLLVDLEKYKVDK